MPIAIEPGEDVGAGIAAVFNPAIGRFFLALLRPGDFKVVLLP
jgi:hypothetical protein